MRYTVTLTETEANNLQSIANTMSIFKKETISPVDLIREAVRKEYKLNEIKVFKNLCWWDMPVIVCGNEEFTGHLHIEMENDDVWYGNLITDKLMPKGKASLKVESDTGDEGVLAAITITERNVFFGVGTIPKFVKDKILSNQQILAKCGIIKKVGDDITDQNFVPFLQLIKPNLNW